MYKVYKVVIRTLVSNQYITTSDSTRAKKQAGGWVTIGSRHIRAVFCGRKIRPLERLRNELPCELLSLS